MNEQEMERWVALQLRVLWLRQLLGPRPRRRADQDSAIERASDALDADDSPEAARARRHLAISYLVLAANRSGGPLDAAEAFSRAIGIYEGGADADQRRAARAGMVVFMSQDGWAPRPA